MTNTDLEKAEEYWKKADAAAFNLEKSKSSKLFFKAAKYYREAGRPHMEKSSEARGWSQKAQAIESTCPEDNLQAVELFDKAINTSIEGLQYPEADPTITEGNMRHFEGQKYAFLANLEVMRATPGSTRPEHLFRAAEYVFSAACCEKAAAELAKKDDKITAQHIRMGSYYNGLSHAHYYRAWANEEMKNWQESLQECKQAKEHGQRSVKEYWAALNRSFSKALMHNLQNAEKSLTNYNNEITEITPSAYAEWKAQQKRTKLPNFEVTPELNVCIKFFDGLKENLVTGVIVELKNTGRMNASKVKVDFNYTNNKGENHAELEQLKAETSNWLGLSIIPMETGTSSFPLQISYEDNQEKSYIYHTKIMIDVSGREKVRPPPMDAIFIKCEDFK